jgi:tetratricopeptide (TPR) repeat protein
MRILCRWQHLFKREQLTLWVGVLVLFLGVIYPWYQLPPQSLKAFETNLFVTNIGRLLAALLAFIGLAFSLNFIVRRSPRLIFLMSLIFTLLFPYFIFTWSPTVAFLASSYYEQGETVSDHVDQNFPKVQAQWKQKIFLDNPELPPANLSMSIPDSRFFQLSSWDKVLLDGLGYKNSFFTFIGKGWIFTLFGLVISLIGFYLGAHENSIVDSNTRLALPKLQNSKEKINNKNYFFVDIIKLVPGILVLITVILISTIGVNIINYKIDTQFAKGEYSQVVNTSKILIRLYPALQGNVSFLERLAKAEFYAEISDPPLINFVKGLEYYRNSDFSSAENYLRKSFESNPSQFLFRGYLATAILNQGVDYLNNSDNRKPAAAADMFERVLAIFPGHMEALYDLMLARVVNGEFQKSAAVAKQIIDEQQYFQEQKIGLLGQAYLHLAWAEYQSGDVNKTWERYRQSVDMKTWGKSPLKEQEQQ